MAREGANFACSPGHLQPSSDGCMACIKGVNGDASSQSLSLEVGDYSPFVSALFLSRVYQLNPSDSFVICHGLLPARDLA